VGGVGARWILKDMESRKIWMWDCFQKIALICKSSAVLLLLLHETLDLFHHGLGDFLGPLVAAEIFGLDAGTGHVLDRLHQCVRLGVELPGANPPHHLGR
jgi:hypothetical protein